MKRIILIIVAVLAVCAIAFSVLFFTGKIHFPGNGAEEAPETSQKADFCVEYMNAYMQVDSTGIVIGSSPEKTEGIPLVSGLSFSQIVVGQALVPAEEAEYAYARKVIDDLKRNELLMDEVYISSEQEATLHVGGVRILLGKDKQTDEKLKELSGFYADLEGLSGTLDMQELSHNNNGYSLKPDKEKKK